MPAQQRTSSTRARSTECRSALHSSTQTSTHQPCTSTPRHTGSRNSYHRAMTAASALACGDTHTHTHTHTHTRTRAHAHSHRHTHAAVSRQAQRRQQQVEGVTPPHTGPCLRGTAPSACLPRGYHLVAAAAPRHEEHRQHRQHQPQRRGARARVRKAVLHPDCGCHRRRNRRARWQICCEAGLRGAQPAPCERVGR